MKNPGLAADGTSAGRNTRVAVPATAKRCAETKRSRLLASWMVLAALIAALASAGGWLSAAENRHPEGTRPEPPRVREIFVPFEDLHVLLDNQPRRVLLSRAEYEKLLKQAKQTPQTRAPQSAVLVSADYTASIRQERAQLSGRLAIDVLEDGLHAVPLDLGGVGLQAATLDGRGAPIGRADDGRPTLLVEGTGRHELALEMVAPLETTAARQVLQFRVPRPPAARLRLTVPGDVEVKSGAEVASRVVDEAGGLTRFELLPQSGDTTLVMTLNSRLQRQSQAVVARSVLVDEVTEAYEKLHATVSLAVLHRAVDRFRFALPEGFEITQVSSPLLARWDVQQENGRRVLAVQLQEQTTETVVLSLSAIKTSAGSQGRATGGTPVPPASAAEEASFPRSWRFPRLQPLDVVGQVAVVGLLVEQRLEARSIAANEKELIPIDTAVLSRALPATIFHAEPGTPPLRPVVAYYAPQGDFSLTAEFDKPEAKLAVTTNLLLILADGGQEVRGGFAVLPRQEKRFSLDFSAPADWQVTGVTAADEKPLSFERYGAVGPGAGGQGAGVRGQRSGAGGTRIHVRLPQAVPPGEEYRVYFHATHTPPGWLGEWEKEEQEVEFPVFAVIGAARDQGAIAVEARDDMTVRPLKVPLRPLDEAEKEKYGLAGVATNLAYRYESPGYEATLAVRRTEPRLTARTFSLLRVQPGALSARYELIYDVQQARTRSLALLLPEKGTPETLSIQGLGDVKLKQYESQLVEVGGRSMRRWNVQLEEARRGAIHLAVVFQQPLPDEQLKDFALPIVAAASGQSAVGSRQWAGARLAYQSGVVAVEGSAELDVTVKTAARRVDVGEFADAEYQPGRRLLGVYGFVGEPAAVSVDASRDPGYGLPEAIVQRAELSTHVSAEGITQTQAQFKLRTKALYLEVRLPPESNLWAGWLDGAPLKPQRDQASLLVSLPAAPGGGGYVRRPYPPTARYPAGALRDLRIIYETPVAVSPGGKLSVPAPELLLRAGADAPAVAVPLNDLVWRLHLPSGYEVVRSGGTVVPDQGELDRPLPAAVQVAGVLYWLSGGVNPFWGVQQAARLAARGSAKTKKSGMRTASADHFEPLAGESREIPTAHEQTGAKFDVGAPAAAERPAEVQPPAERPTAEPKVVAAEEAPITFPSVVTWENLKAKLPPPGRKLEGVRSLQIDLEQAAAEGGQTVTFRSLGVEPQLEVTLAKRLQGCMLGWGLALAVGLVGLAITNRPAGSKARFVLIVALLATLVPLVYDSIAAARVCNMVFYAASLLVPYYLLAGLTKWLAALLRRRWGGWHGHLARGAVAPAVTAVAILLAAAVITADAADPQAGAPPGKDGPYVIQVVEPSPPVDVPEDAVILPYDPESNTGIQGADKLLVPYAKYVELWNRAHPDKKIEAPPPPAPYALAGGAYTATLEGDEYLLVSGQLELEVYADGYVTIPLGLAGGVLARAELDGKPARLSVAGVIARPAGGLSRFSRSENGTVPLPMQQAQTAPAANQSDARPGTLWVPPNDSLVVLYASGKGRHRLELSVRLRLSRQGGWRVAEGMLPAAPATALSLKVPKPQTELRLGRLSDRRSYETGQADEKIETALGTDGAVSIQWRPKVAEALLDRSLTARSTAVLDVQEDGLRLVWRLQLEFGGSQREEFRVGVPADYLLEKVEGSNVRGWQRDQQQPQTVDIMLLKPAKDREDFTFHLWRKGPVGQGGLAEFEVPVVSVGDAALHEGQLTIRRSPLLDLRTVKDSGLRRIDLDGVAGVAGVAGVERSEPPAKAPAVGSLRSTTATPAHPLRGEPDNQQSPLGIRPYQAYQFVTSQFSMRLAATPLEPNLSAVVQTVCKIAEYERSLESRVAVQAADRPVYGVELLVPEDLEITQVSTPGGCEWAVESGQSAVGGGQSAVGSGRKKLSVYLAAGRQGEVPILLGGTLGERGQVERIPLPGIEVLHVERQQGQIAVQLDPAFDVRTEDLQNCKSVLLKQLYGWLNPGQQRAVRLALDYDRPDYSGTLRLVPRQPEVACETITNVRVTDRAVEETILLDFTIHNAGIRALSFRLPAGMEDCRIRVPMLRQQSIEPTEQGDLRVSLELQDEVMDQLRVLVENDRPLGSQYHAAPIPIVEKWRVGRQYVALEGASRDEVVVDEAQLKGLEVVSRQQKEWDRLKGILGDQITQAYLVAAGAQKPQLVFETKTAKAVETAGARIGLAETVLIVDSYGAYRAAVTYRLDNATEQFLQIELPPEATLWTAQVAGQPVKPATVPGTAGGAGADKLPLPPADPRQVRIPLVKTAPGDLDYAVLLIYGGKMPAPGSLGTANFPLVHTKNVNVELSQVRLFVPKTHRWFALGGTMGLATLGEEDDLAAGFVSYTTKQVERLRETMRGSGKFAKVRAAYNLKQLDTAMSQFQSARGYDANPNLKAQLRASEDALQRGKAELRDFEAAPQQAGVDNRLQLNTRYEGQKSSRARNVVHDLGHNWSAQSGQAPAPGSVEANYFNSQWLDSSQLNNKATVVVTTDGRVIPEQAGKPGGAKPGQPVIVFGGKSAGEVQAQPKAPEVAQGAVKAGLVEAGQATVTADEEVAQLGRHADDTVVRYQNRLEQQVARPPAVATTGSAVSLTTGDAFSADHDILPFVPDSQGQAATRAESGVDMDALAAAVSQRVEPGGQRRMTVRGAAAVPAVVAPPTGLASLQLELPEHEEDFYQVYRFSTPRGEVEITAWAVSENLLTRLLEVASVLIAVGLLGYLVRLARAGRFARLWGATGSTLMICVGLPALLFGILPVAGLVAVVGGVVIKIRRAAARSAAAGQPITAEVVQR